MDNKLVTGITDAIGFVGGAMGGLFLGQAFGFDALTEGYNNASILGILLCGAGGGLGLQLTRWARAKAQESGKP